MTKKFYITDNALAAMNAVEGLHLTDDAKKFLTGLRNQNLTPEEQRKAIREAYKETA